MSNRVTPKQLDAIREVVNIGAGHAATNLSALTGLRVMISVPRIQWAADDVQAEPELPGDGPLLVIAVPIIGVTESGGEGASLLLAREAALRLVGAMLRRENASTSIGALEESALNEMGNIVCAAYVGVLGTFLHKSVMIGTPELHEGERHALAHHVTGLMIETDFSFLDTTFEGVFVLSHTDVSFTSLLKALGMDDAPAAAS